jgi:hemerythrin-like domain-containing protein
MTQQRSDWMSARELKGPVKIAQFVHEAIRTESQWLQDAVLALAPDDTQGAQALSQRLAAFEQALATHEDSEDLVLFPPLEARNHHIADTYEFDHNRHRSHGNALSAGLDELVQAGGNRRGDLLKIAGEQAILFNGYMNLHIDKEDELLFPLYDEMFSPEEQMAHGAAAEGRISQEAMGQLTTWAFQRMDTANRGGFLTDLKDVMPSPAFNGMSQGLMRAIPEREWQELTRRLPGLVPQAA